MLIRRERGWYLTGRFYTLNKRPMRPLPLARIYYDSKYYVANDRVKYFIYLAEEVI